MWLLECRSYIPEAPMRTAAHSYKMLIYLVSRVIPHSPMRLRAWGEDCSKAVKCIPLLYISKELVSDSPAKSRMVQASISERPSPADLLIVPVKYYKYSQYHL